MTERQEFFFKNLVFCTKKKKKKSVDQKTNKQTSPHLHLHTYLCANLNAQAREKNCAAEKCEFHFYCFSFFTFFIHIAFVGGKKDKISRRSSGTSNPLEKQKQKSSVSHIHIEHPTRLQGVNSRAKVFVRDVTESNW